MSKLRSNERRRLCLGKPDDLTFVITIVAILFCCANAIGKWFSSQSTNTYALDTCVAVCIHEQQRKNHQNDKR